MWERRNAMEKETEWSKWKEKEKSRRKGERIERKSRYYKKKILEKLKTVNNGKMLQLIKTVAEYWKKLLKLIINKYSRTNAVETKYFLMEIQITRLVYFIFILFFSIYNKIREFSNWCFSVFLFHLSYYSLFI